MTFINSLSTGETNNIIRFKPYALVWKNDFYYLIGQFEDEEHFRHYRVDRMRDIKQTEEKFKRESFDLAEYVQKSFNMYPGEEQSIKLIFRNDLINVIFDRFGLEADVQPEDAENFVLRAKANISDGIVHWLLTWGSFSKQKRKQLHQEKYRQMRRRPKN